MTTHPSGSGGAGLERSCDEHASDWVRQTDVIGGVEFFEARLQRLNYRRHRHDTYAISVTESGSYLRPFVAPRMSACRVRWWCYIRMSCTTAGPERRRGSAYRQLYVEPALLFDGDPGLRQCRKPAVRAAAGHHQPDTRHRNPSRFCARSRAAGHR